MNTEDQMAQFYERRGAYPECLAGWYQLILDLDAKISSIEPGYKVDQVKEKFGGPTVLLRPDEHRRRQLRTCG